MAVAVAIVIILIVGVVSVVLLANRSRSTTGALSRETRRRDSAAVSEAEAEQQVSSSTELEAAGRERAQETRETMGGGVATRRVGEVTRWEPVDEEELGVSRRQFLNRAVLTVVGFAGIGAFAPAMLAFLWPSGSAGFGGKINAGSTDDILAEIDEKNAPKYVPEARAYVQRYPSAAVSNAESVYSPLVLAGMEQGIIALYQKCPHLGCRVPWCQSSQWFECPCHGSKYNRVGEKKAGPAPRGMDLFPIEVGNSLTIDTGIIELGAPIGTDTTGQQQEGPLCV
jgi:cytochrome b6-f complex iron-sulfur subunit